MVQGPDKRKSPRVGMSLVIRVQHESRAEFVSSYATNISQGGIFIRTTKPLPVGTVLNFRLELKGSETMLRGIGQVVWTRDPAAPGEDFRQPGMGVKFLKLDRNSKNLVRRIVEIKVGKAAAEKAEKAVREAGQEPAEMATGRGDSDRATIDIDVTDFVEPAAEVRAETTTAARPADSSSPVIGIDLGTTNSCAAVVRDGKPEVIPLRGGHRTIPSVVAWSDDGKVFTGPPAKAQMELNPRNSVYGAKRLVGRPFWSPVVQQMKNFFRYELVESPNRQAAVKIRDRTVTLEEISSCILKEIREAASQTLRQDVTRAVISVPAYFNQNQRNGVREAGVLAGLQVECVVNEPTAAAIAYGYSRGLEQRVLVYDLGGGTFDVTVLELCGSIYQVLATGGDTFLGGVDFDTRLAESIFGEFCRGIGTKPRLDPVSATRLLQAAERAKCDLSEKEETGVTLPFFVNLEGTPLSLDTTVTRDRLEQVCRPLVEETLQVVHDVLARSRLRADQLDAILLVGGQSRMPLIWRRIREEFGIGPFKGTHPDEAVAQGAALLAGTVRKIDSVLLVDVVPLSIGIGLRGGKYQKVIQAQTALPASGSTTVRTWEYNQSVVQLDVYQGEEDDVALNEYLGSITMEGITLASTGDIQVKIDLVLDVNGQLRASWQELGIDQTHEVEIESKKPGITDRQET